MLPEGEARRAIAREVGESASDTYGLIRALGRDCAGAVVIHPADDPPPPSPTTATAEPLMPRVRSAIAVDMRGFRICTTSASGCSDRTLWVRERARFTSSPRSTRPGVGMNLVLTTGLTEEPAGPGVRPPRRGIGRRD
ncbi:MAG: HipA N-terminal domain-containing protein [Acidimicrobiales bacterium]